MTTRGLILPSDDSEDANIALIAENTATTNTELAALANGAVSGVLQDPSGNVLTPLRVCVAVAASQTDAALVAAVAGKSVRVLSATLDCGATATVFTFNSKPSGAGTAIAGPYPQAIDGRKSFEYNPQGWFQTTSGQGLSATTGAGSSTTVTLVYVLV